jgi:hypothetical protein
MVLGPVTPPKIPPPVPRSLRAAATPSGAPNRNTPEAATDRRRTLFMAITFLSIAPKHTPEPLNLTPPNLLGGNLTPVPESP